MSRCPLTEIASPSPFPFLVLVAFSPVKCVVLLEWCVDFPCARRLIDIRTGTFYLAFLSDRIAGRKNRTEI